MERKEAEIRDALSTRLELLEPGLQLIKKEKYLPNIEGTRGFVDLFARDQQGKYVLIELKRSSTASREALHEVLKYLEAVKVGLSARDAEIRVFIVSTEWSELRVPFSSFVQRTSCDVKGFDLKIDSLNVPISATPISPLKLTEDRLFAPWHELNFYETHTSMTKGVLSYEQCCEAKGINNYVLIVLEPSAEHHQRTVDATLAQIEGLGEWLGLNNQKCVDELIATIPEYKYLVYFATLQLSEELCWDAIRYGASVEELEEFEALVHEMKGKERLQAFHEKIYAAEPMPENDYFEIGTPAKFGSRIMDDESWNIIELRRYGTLKANEVLTNEAIIDDLRGVDGNSLQGYKKKFKPANRSEVAEVRLGAQRCLRDNPIWRNQIVRCIEDFLPIDPSITATIEICNPSNFCLALYQFLTQDQGELYVPQYTFVFERTEIPVSVIFGTMHPNGNAPSFTNLLNKHFQGDGFRFLFNLAWGGYLKDDVKISKDLGMTYNTFKIDINGSASHFWKLTEMGWESCKPTNPFSGFQEFIEENEDFVSDICEFYSTHWDGVTYTYQQNNTIKFRT